MIHAWTLFDGGVTGHHADAVERQAAELAEQRNSGTNWPRLSDCMCSKPSWMCKRPSSASLSPSRPSPKPRKTCWWRVTATPIDSAHTEVLDAETLHTGRECNYVNAALDAALASLRLKRAAGEL